MMLRYDEHGKALHETLHAAKLHRNKTQRGPAGGSGAAGPKGRYVRLLQVAEGLPPREGVASLADQLHHSGVCQITARRAQRARRARASRQSAIA